MNYDMNTYAAYNNFETYGGSAGEQQYTSVNQASGAYPWNASASAPVASQSTPEQPSQQYDYNYGYGNYSGGYQDYSEGYDYGYDGSYDQWNTTSSNTTITSPAKPPQRGGYTPAETQRGGYAQSMAPKRGGYAPAETSQRGGFAQSAAPQTDSYSQSDSSQTGGYAQPPAPQRGGFTQPPPMQRGGYIQPPPPQRGGYAQAPPPQRGGFIQPPPSQRGSYTQAPPPQRGGYTQPPPSLIGGYTQPPPSQFGGYTQPPPQRGGYSQSGAPQKSDYTPEETAQRGGYIQTATTQNYEYTGPAGDNAFAGGNVQGEAPFGRGRGVAGMRGGGRGMGAGRATIGEQNWSNDGDNAKPWNVGRGGFNNNIGYEAKKPFGFGSGNRGRGRGGRQDETGFGHFVQSANNNRVPMNQESINASSTTQALISRWKTFTRGFTDCGNPISNLECSLKASKINILQLQFECKFLSKCNTYSIFTGVLHINKIVDNNVTESLFIARGVGLSKKSAKMDCYEKAYNLLLNSKVQDIVSQRDCGEAKLSQDVQTLYKENPEEFSELLKKSIALIEVVVPKAPQTPINSGQGATRGRGHTGNQGISRGGTQAMGRGGVGVSRGGLGVGRGAGQAMGRGGPGVGRGAGQAMGRGGLGVGRGAGQAMGRGGGQAISRGGGGSHGVGRGGSLGTSSAVNKVAGRGGIQAGSRGGSIIGKKRASNTSLSDIDAKRPRFSLAPTKTVGILMNPADPLIDKLAKLKELLKEEGITKLHIVPKVDQIAHKTAINIKNIYRFQDVPILGFESKMPVYCEVYFDDVFMADGIADFKRNVAMQDAYNNLATTLYSKPLEAIVSCSRIWQAYMCSDPDVCNVVTKWQGEDNNSLLTSNLTNMKQMMQSMPDVTIPIEKMVLTEHESDKDIQNIFKALELSATRNLMLLECEIVRNPDLKFTCSISLQGRLLASRTHGTKNGAKRVCSEAVMNELKKNNDYIFVATEYIGKKITNQELVLEAAKKKALGEPPAKVFFKKPEHKDGENAKPEVDATKFELENKVETEEMKALVPWMAAVMYDIIDDYYQKITLEDLMVNVTDMTKIQRDVVNACASKMGLRVITKLKTHTDSSLLRRTVTAQDMCKMLQLHGGQSGRYKLVTCKNKLSEVEKEKFRAECLQQHKKLVDARTNDDPDAQPTEPTPAPIKSTVRPAAKTAPAPQTRPAPKIRPASAYRPVRPQSRPAFRVPHHMQAVNRPMPLMSSNLPYGPPRMPRFPFPRF